MLRTAIIALVFCLVAAATFLLVWYEPFSRAETPVEIAVKKLEEGELKCLALAAWRHSSRGAGTELEKQLVAIAHLNVAESTGRDLCTVFKLALPMRPKGSKIGSGYKTWLEGGWSKTKQVEYSKVVLLVDELVKHRNDLAATLLDGKKHLACVTRFVRAKPGMYTWSYPGIGMSLDEQATAYVAEGYNLVHTSADGARFYCPSKKKNKGG